MLFSCHWYCVAGLHGCSSRSFTFSAFHGCCVTLLLFFSFLLSFRCFSTIAPPCRSYQNFMGASAAMGRKSYIPLVHRFDSAIIPNLPSRSAVGPHGWVQIRAVRICEMSYLDSRMSESGNQGISYIRKFGSLHISSTTLPHLLASWREFHLRLFVRLFTWFFWRENKGSI